MKLLYILLLSSLALFGEVEFAENYKAGLKQAEKENKMVMVMLSKEDCDACWYMENVVFEDDAVAEAIMKDFVPVHLDIHNDFLHDLEYIGTPTFHFITYKEYKRDRLDGAANVMDFKEVLKSALSKR